MEDISEDLPNENNVTDLEPPPDLIYGESDGSDIDDNDIDRMYMIEQQQNLDEQCQYPDDPITDSGAWGSMPASSTWGSMNVFETQPTNGGASSAASASVQGAGESADPTEAPSGSTGDSQIPDTAHTSTCRATVTSRGAIRWPRPWAPPLQVRDRANALMGSRVVRRRQESGSIFMTSPEVTIDEDNTEGRPITMYSWNIGAGGISGALTTLAEWIDVHSPTVVLLQECRITKRTVKRIRKSMLTLMPDYRAYFHCKAWESASDRPPAVITLVRHEIAMKCKPLNVCPSSDASVPSALAGRILPLQLTMPGSLRPLIVVNSWFPHSNYSVNFRKTFLAQCETMHKEWSSKGHVLWIGDLNAALGPNQRTAETPEAAEEVLSARPWDKLVQEWVLENSLYSQDPGEMTWSSLTAEATLDHVLSSPRCPNWWLTVHDCPGEQSDHSILKIILDPLCGTWSRKKPVHRKRKATRPDWSKIHDHVEAFQDEVLLHTPVFTDDMTPAVRRQKWEEVLLAAGHILPQYKVGGRRAPYRDKETVAILMSIKGLKRLRRMLSWGNTSDPAPWDKVIAEIEEYVLTGDNEMSSWREDSHLRAGQQRSIRSMIDVRKHLLKKRQTAMRRDSAQQFITERRAKVDAGGRGIVQQIMGKNRSQAEIISLTSLHPDTIWCQGASSATGTPDQSNWGGDTLAVTHWACTRTDRRKVAGANLWKIEVHRHTDVYDACLWLLAGGFVITKLENTKTVVRDDSNILSAVEFELGTAGMAKDTQCERCGKNSVIPLSTVQAGVRTNANLCTNCNKPCKGKRNLDFYNDVPWTAKDGIKDCILKDAPRISTAVHHGT